MKNLACILLSLICFAAVPAFAEIELNATTKVDGLSWAEKQDRWKKGDADKGGPQEKLNYAKSIEKTNPQLAAEYAEKAGAENLAEAWYWLGETGIGKENQLTYFDRAARLGYPNAFVPLFDLTLFRAGANANPAKAKEYANIAREMNINIPGGAGLFRTIDICADAGKPLMPTADRIQPRQKQAFKDVNCAGLKNQAQPGKAAWNDYRYCLLSKPQINGNELAEVYANGWGVKRNPKLAIAMLCHSPSTQPGLSSMVDMLYQTRTVQTLPAPFVFCNDAGCAQNFRPQQEWPKK